MNGLCMNLKVFEYIIAVDKVRNFHAAAKICGVSQPALSSAIKAFEKIIAINVFSRTTRRVTVTDAGKKVITQLKIIQGEVDALSELANYHAEVVDKPIRVAVDESLSGLLLPKMLTELEKRMAILLPEIYEETPTTSRNKLVNHHIDIAVIPKIDLSGSGLISEEVLQEPIYACLPKYHELTSKTDLSLRDITAHKIIMPKANHTVSRELLATGMLQDASITESQTIDGVAMMVHANMGIGFIPAGMITRVSSLNLCLRECSNLPRRSIHMVWRANETRTHCLGHIRRVLAGLSLPTNLGNLILP